MTVTLYATIVEITEGYLGPAAQRFIDRQITFHLSKRPEDITRADLEKLNDWIKVSLSLLTDDPSVVDDYSARIAKI